MLPAATGLDSESAAQFHRAFDCFRSRGKEKYLLQWLGQNLYQPRREVGAGLIDERKRRE